MRGKVVVESAGLRKEKAKLQPIEANVTIEGSDFVVKSHPVWGDYYRPLAPGKYTVVVRKEGYPTARSNITVPEDGKGVVRDFVLRPKRTNTSTTVAAGRKAMMITVSAATEREHAIVLLVVGAGIMWGLWIVHRRMVHRTFALQRQRSM